MNALSKLTTLVDSKWLSLEKDEDGQIERLKCWDIILSDESLVTLVGNSDNEKGKSILLAMKEIRALDQIQKDGRISEAEFKRLYDVDVLAEAAVKVTEVRDAAPPVDMSSSVTAAAVERDGASN